MPRCSGCSGDRCSCVIVAGENVTVEGAGTFTDPFVVSAEGGGGGGGGGFKTGDVKMSAVATPEAGWLPANGAAVSRSSYSALFAAISTTYGPGDGSTTFNLPDLAGRFPLGADGTHAHGGTGGEEASILTVGNLPGHTHTMAHIHSIAHGHAASTTSVENAQHVHSGTTSAAGLHQHGYTSPNASVNMPPRDVGAVGSRQFLLDAVNSTTGPDGVHGHTVNTGTESATHAHVFATPDFNGNSGGSSAGSTGSTGSADPFTNMPPWTGVTFLIKT